MPARWMGLWCDGAATAICTKGFFPNGTPCRFCLEFYFLKKIATEKASTRLQKAKSSLAGVKASRSYAEFSMSWTDLLTSLNSVYTILGRGARSSPQSCQWWFGMVEKERKEDQLLQYLQQARNADEHGIEPVTDFQPGSIGIGKTDEPMHVSSLVLGSDSIEIMASTPSGRRPSIIVTRPHVRLIAVIDDRFGTQFDPPTSHLGVRITDPTPIAVAYLGIVHHEKILMEAMSRAKDS